MATHERAHLDRALEIFAVGPGPAASDVVRATAERAQETFERLESPVTEDVEILLSPDALRRFVRHTRK